jgi:hypothetical protein
VRTSTLIRLTRPSASRCAGGAATARVERRAANKEKNNQRKMEFNMKWIKINDE